MRSSWEDFEEVVKYAHKSDIDCIVVGAHGRIGFRQLFAGSVATEVVKKAHCSVSVIRPRY
ncbi:MAG: universal stress protein [Bilophila wadsworthia]